jgi:hypothetical protein
MTALPPIEAELRDRLRLRRVLRPDRDGRFRLQTDGRSFGDLLGILDEPALATLPIDALVIDKTLNARTLPALLASPHLARIRRLRLIDLKLGDGSFEQLVAAPGLAGLVELSITSTQVGEHGLSALATANMRLDALGLHGSAIDEPDLTRLVRSGALASLRSLGVSRPLGSDTLQAITQDPSLAGLRHLSLRSCKLSTSDMAFFAKASAASLETLGLSDNPFAGAALRALRNAPFARTLAHLGLQSTAVDDAALGVLAGAGIELLSLWLRGSRVLGGGIAKLVEAACMANLETLELSGRLAGSEAGDRAAAALAPLTRLRTLALASMNVSDTGARAIAQNASKHLASLDLRCNRLTAAGAAALATGSYRDSLEVLELEAYPTYPKIGSAGAIAIGGAGFSKLRRLNLRKQNIGCEGVRAIAALPALREIELWDCAVDDAAIEALSRASFSPALELLDVSFNPATAIAEPIARFRGLSALSLSDTRASDDVVAELVSNLPESVERIALDYATRLGPKTLAELVRRAGQLYEVSATFVEGDGARKTLRAALAKPTANPKPKRK